MLDRFLIFTKTGVVLWSMTMLPPEEGSATLSYAVTTGTEPTTAAVNGLVRDVLLPARGGGAVTGAGGSNSLDTPDYTLHWLVDNNADVVFTACVPRQFSALVTYIPTLLASVRTVFMERFGDRIRAAGATGSDGEPFDFSSAFDKLLEVAERTTHSGAGGSASARRGGGIPLAPKVSAISAASVTPRGGGLDSPVGPGDDDVDRASDGGDDDDRGDVELDPQFMSSKNLALARAKLAARGSGKGGVKGASASLKGSLKGGVTPASASKGKVGSKGRSWGDFSYSRDKEASLDFSKDKGLGDTAGGGAGGDGAGPEVSYSGTGASGSGKGLMDEDDDDLDAEGIVAAAAAAGSAGSKGAGASSAGLGSWLSHTRVGTFLGSLAGTKVLDLADLAPVIEALKQQLITKNVNSDVALAVCDGVASELVGRKLEAAGSVANAFTDALKASCERLLTPRRAVDVLAELRAKKAARTGPYVIVFVGINGVGKSTSLSKVAFHLRDHGHSVLIAACDSFRAGAVEQLKRHCTALDVPLFQQGYAKDPVSIAQAAIKEATDSNMDCVLVDTAGRMQNNGPLMQQLAKLVAVNKPDLVLMVAEALVGSDGVDQLTSFDRALVDYAVDRSQPRRIDGVLLTKFDTVDDKVGAALSMVYTTGIPVVYLGTGQKYQDLRKLNVAGVVRSLLAA